MSAWAPSAYGSAGRWSPDSVVLDPPLVRAPAWLSADDLLGPPVLGGGFAFCVSRSDGIIAFDSASGRQVWRLETERAWGTCQLSSGGLLAIPWPGELVILDPATGAARERQSAGDLSLEYSVVVGERIVSPLEVGALGSWDLGAGEVVWRVRSDWNLSLLAANDSVVCIAEEGAYVALDLETGAQRWRFDVTELGRHTTLMHGDRLGAAASHAIVTDDTAFGCVIGGWLIALDAADGRLRWKRQVGDVSPRNVALAPGGRLLYLSDDSLTTIDATSGLVVAHARLSNQERINGDGPFAPMAVTERFIWTVDALGRLIAISREDARITFRQVLHGRVALPPVVGDGRLFVVDLDGGLDVFSALA